MGRAIDLFVTYRFLKILTTPFDKQEAFKLGIIDKDGNRIIPQQKGWSRKTKAPPLETVEEKEAYTILHKLIFNIKKLFNKVPGLRTKVGTYAAALYLLKDTFKESVDDPDMFEKEFMKYLKEEGVELDDDITESVIGFGEMLPKGDYTLVQDILNKEEEELTAKAGDTVIAYEDQSPIDTILGVEIFPVVHKKSGSVIYVGLEDIKK